MGGWDSMRRFNHGGIWVYGSLLHIMCLYRICRVSDETAVSFGTSAAEGGYHMN